MKVNEFIEMYKKNARIDIANVLDVKKYIGIEYKKNIASLVLDNCTTVVDGEVNIDSVERYLLFTISVISAHTNLEFLYENDEDYSAIDCYDMLCASGLLVKIIDTFKDDYMACQEILNMMTSDRMNSHMTIEKKILNFIDGVQNILSDGISNLLNKINLDDLPDGLNIDKTKLLELYSSIK